MNTRRLCLRLLLTTAAPLAWAQQPPATPASAGEPAIPARAETLAALFEDEGLPERLAADFARIDAITAQAASADPDPERRARRQRQHALVNPWLRAQFDWPTRLLPLATAAYQRVLGEDDAQALRAYYRTPAGRLVAREMPSAITAAHAALAQHLQAQARAWQQAAVEGTAPAPPAPQAPRDDHERMAGEILLRIAPQATYAEVVRAKVKALDAIEPHWPADSTRDQQRAWRQQVNARMRAFEAPEAMPVLAQAIAARVPPTDLQTMLDAERQPARAAQRALAGRAAQALHKDLQAWQSRQLMPELQRKLQETSDLN